MEKLGDLFFIQSANRVKNDSTCIRRQVGAVLVKDDKIISTGYNAAPDGVSQCIDRGCERERLGIPSGTMHEKCRGVHAEQNAILSAAREGKSTKDSILYVTTKPCIICAKMCINAGIKRIVFSEDYPDDISIQLLEEAGIEIKIINTEKGDN